jgi:hypothetical protein
MFVVPLMAEWANTDKVKLLKSTKIEQNQTLVDLRVFRP